MSQWFMIFFFIFHYLIIFKDFNKRPNFSSAFISDKTKQEIVIKKNDNYSLSASGLWFFL
jgi:hypothetical protein